MKKLIDVTAVNIMKAEGKTVVYVDDNTLTVNVGRLRKKLEACGLSGFIRTKFGEGYYIEEEAE